MIYMAKAKEKTVTTPEAKVTPQPKAQAEVYTVDDFTAAAEKLWPNKKKRPSRYLIAAAFKVSGKTAVTKAEGMQLVNDFAKKEVK